MVFRSVNLTNFAIARSLPLWRHATATMNISLPDQMKDWVERQTEGGRYSNSSDYVRDLIRRDQARAEQICRPRSTKAWPAA